MKAIFLSLIFLLAMSLGVVAQEETEAAEEEETSTVQMYIGVIGCKKCHKTTKQGKQFKIWEASKHAQAYETLKTEEADRIAKEKGLTKPAHQSAECLQCHVTGHDVADEFKKTKFKMEAGVQCETCHGAGSLYKPKKVMKDRDASIAKGMLPIFVADGSAEKQCLECHNTDSPTYKEFNFEERWQEIAHPVPEKK